MLNLAVTSTREENTSITSYIDTILVERSLLFVLVFKLYKILRYFLFVSILMIKTINFKFFVEASLRFTNNAFVYLSRENNFLFYFYVLLILLLNLIDIYTRMRFLNQNISRIFVKILSNHKQ